MGDYDDELLTVLRGYARRFPRRPDGRIDYSSADSAPVLSCFVRFEGQILLLQRSRTMETYPGRWSSVSGFLDQVVPLARKVEEELREELGLGSDLIARLITAEPHDITDPDLGKTWITYPALVDLTRRPEITLDWEHEAAIWIAPSDVIQFSTLPDLEVSLCRVLAIER